ncbi:SPASM domain-containing protein [Kordiimonas sp. SCSIO 12603]|uniref:SPASM domain-containing protein n=1 Tax=Kordiimonas sp. SCSIO 12603 TaxID=2829596 RepID=UPI002103C229|nr:SPASM domain-containing protein [Kordiimonas sp. SCSIO 12603]UTW59599.1 SPASM domain-containing protein [Kordiimonas sp. SCSIO 12603]
MADIGLLKKIFGKKKPKNKRINDQQGLLNEEKDLTGRFCSLPFEKLEIHGNGNVYSCCPGWIDLPIGNARDNHVRDLWNGESSQKFRESILDGSFRYCRKKICPSIQNDSLPTVEEALKNPKYAEIISKQKRMIEDKPVEIDFSHDRSCNLECPSCRVNKILLTEGPEFDEKQYFHNQLVEEYFSEPSDHKFSIKVTGSGDPFASKIYREFLSDLDGADYPNLTVNLQTNGVMFTPKNWDRIHKIHDNLGFILVSADAATSETYDPIRKGGDWGLLMQNLEFLGQRRAEGKFTHFRMDFVVQDTNFHEMPAYVDLSKKMGADVVYFMIVRNWGTWSPEEFDTKCIWRETHPKFAEFMQVLRDPRLGDPMVDLGNVTHYRKQALEQVS